MNLSLIKIKKHFPHFNERPITADDFWQLVRGEKKQLTVAQMPLLVDGYYTARGERHYILIDSRLSGVRWLHTALHELHHYLFDVPGQNEGYTFYRNGRYLDRREYRADAFATIAVLPWPELVRISAEDLTSTPWLCDLVRDRIAVRTDFGI